MGVAGVERERWEERHGKSLEEMSLEPAALLLDFSELFGGAALGKALDVACGNGRNALFLASLGFEVTAIDFSGPAVEFVQRRARELDVPVNAVQADVSDYDFGDHMYSVVSNFFFLDRNVAPRLVRALAPGGHLFFETFTVDERTLGHEIRREFCLEHNEALRLFAPLRVLYYREGVMADGQSGAAPRAVGRLVARQMTA